MKHVTLLKNLSHCTSHQSRYWIRGIMAFLAIVVFVLAGTTAQAQTRSVSGTVQDESGTPIPGVNVLLKGTSQGTISDVNGNFNLSVEGSNATLVFSFVGYATQEVAVGNQSSINVTLAEEADVLSEVVVVGYGTQKKSDVTGAITSVGSQTIKEIPAPDVANALQGRVAGVFVQRTGSKPGSGTRIRIRGNRSLTGSNDPLIILDGIPYLGNLNSINQGDIQSVEVLKDASATAIYGSRGSNGVIIITTNRGRPGKMRVSYEGYAGISTPLDKYDVYNGEDWATLVQDSGFGPLTDDETQSILNNSEVNWQDLFLKNGYITNHQLSLSGGSEKTQYLASANFFEETNAMPGQAFSRTTLRLSLDHEINDRMRFGVSSMTTYAKTEGEGNNPFFQLLTLSPLINPYTETGEINRLPWEGHIDGPFAINPLLLYNEELWEDERYRLQNFTSLYAEVDIIEGLKYRINVGLDASFEKRGFFNSALLGSTGANNAGITNSWGRNYTIENLLLYEKTFAEKHSIKFTGLYSVQENEWEQQSFNTTGVASDQLQYYNFQQANETIAGGQNYDQWGIESLMARVNYNYDDRYVLTLTVRRDGSSRLADGNKYFNYPAVAAGWNIHNEAFMSGIDFVSNLKLRVGYGTTSNQAIAAFASLGQLGPIPYSFGPDGGENGYYVTSLPNSNLGWEFTSNINIGLDFGLLTNRITGSIELYQQETDDILQSRALPIMSGVPGGFQSNIGETKNQGIEVGIQALAVEAKSPGDFSLDFDFNFTTWSEEIVSLADGVTRNVNNAWFVGQPVDVIFDYQKVGIWQLDEADAASEFDGRLPGDIKVADLNGNGIRDDDDRTIIGKLNPDWIGGLTTRASYKGFDLSVVAFARVGGKIVSRLHQGNIGFPIATMEGRRNQVKVDYWTPDNPTNAYPRSGQQSPAYGSTLGYFDGTFMKIRSINLGYQIPQSILTRVGIQSARVYVTANNPFKAFFSDLVDAGAIDPEPNNFGGTTTPGFGGRLNMSPDAPIMRSFIFGVNLQL